MIMTQPATFEQLWSAIADIGRDPIDRRLPPLRLDRRRPENA